MMFIALKTEDGTVRGKLSFYCRILKVTRQGFYKYLSKKNHPWKYQNLADAMKAIVSEDECNDTYGRIRMYQALLLKQPEGIRIPSERTVYRIMEEIGLSHRPKRKPNGITKADREAHKSNDLLERNFTSAQPLKKCVTDITEIKAKDGKLYVSAIFDCFDATVLGLAMDTNMKSVLCERTLDNAVRSYPVLRGAVIHSDRGTQYTSKTYRKAIGRHGILQSMNSAGGRCHDNARCESMWARMKEELLYERNNTEKMTIEELKTLIWRYFISYWNNRRICSANEGLPPMVKRQRYYESLAAAA
ncbi:IS3 family transposase [Clostridioides sp. ES-S-0108-01]|uniref:IS3 family transposase n=1 Tax=Clostridioides sp. ES-S-0108-01 TaxID=2770773 RepID=UPI001D0CA95C|nr:IS3 family transposase [Clostridioides sp. ES-S-0108-01]UDN50951.1 IS3 family transposase [Clostridioides sp. ES-S-0107-01]